MLSTTPDLIKFAMTSDGILYLDTKKGNQYINFHHIITKSIFINIKFLLILKLALII